MLQTESQETHMQVKLRDLGNLISKYAKYASILVLLVLITYQVNVTLFSSVQFISRTTVYKLIEHI
jgi:hypothetical protein